MVKLNSSEMFIKDPVDSWGKEQTIGLAELAVRTHSPPMMYDRRGDVIYWDNFESPTQKFTPLVTGAGTCVRTNSYSKTGDFSVKCTTDTNIDDKAKIGYFITDFHLGNVGCQSAFSTSDSDYAAEVMVRQYTGTAYWIAKVRFDVDNEVLQYADSTGAWVTFATGVEYWKGVRNWTTIKLVADLSTKQYVRALAFGVEYDLSGIMMQSIASFTNPYLYVNAGIAKTDAAATAKVCYVDEMIVTENEPT